MSTKTNIIIVEDESIVAKDIQNSLKKLGYNVLGTASTGDAALELAEQQVPDLFLLDIMLKGDKSGIDVAAIVKEKYNVPVVFLTAYADASTFGKAKETEPYGYIIKPFKEIDLQTSIEMALFKHKKTAEIKKERDFLYKLVENKDNSGILFIKANSKLIKLKTTDIIFVEALKDYVTINTSNTRYTIHSTMKDIFSKLPSSEFIRVHRSFIVRIDKIASIDFPNLTLEEDKKQVPIGGSYKDELYERLNFL